MIMSYNGSPTIEAKKRTLKYHLGVRIDNAASRFFFKMDSAKARLLWETLNKEADQGKYDGEIAKPGSIAKLSKRIFKEAKKRIKT